MKYILQYPVLNPVGPPCSRWVTQYEEKLVCVKYAVQLSGRVWDLGVDPTYADGKGDEEDREDGPLHHPKDPDEHPHVLGLFPHD